MSVLMVFVLSVILAFVLTLIYKFLGNQDEARKLKSDMKFYKEKMNEAKKGNNKDEMNKYVSEMLKASQRQMKMNMKPMFASMVLFFLVLGWMGNIYAEVQFTLPVLGWVLNWFWIYFIVTIPFTVIFRKLMGVQ
jgi:uncharacterized membrane protein (DUF106 family)